jgi:virulence-associated protein VapD
MSIEELAQLLPHFETIKKWMASVEEFALEQALEGKNVPGFKVVEGRSVRKISDNSAAIAKLDAAGILPENYLKPAELKTITDLEKMLTKKGFNAILGDLVIKPEGKPALVSVDDPRQPYSKANQDFKDIIENL